MEEHDNLQRGRFRSQNKTLRIWLRSVPQLSIRFGLVMIAVVAMITPVAVVMILVIPVALVQLPSFPVVVVMQMAPICAFIRWALPSSSNPAIAMPVGSPVSFNPGESRTRDRSAPLVAKWGRRSSDENRDLSECWDCYSNCQKRSTYPH